MIYGKGLDATDSNRKSDQYVQMVSLFNAVCVRKIAYELKLMGQCSFQVIYSKVKTKHVKNDNTPREKRRAVNCSTKVE